MTDTSSDALATPVASPVMAPFPHPKKFLIAPPNSSSSPVFATTPAFLIRMPSIPRFNLRESSESLWQDCKKRKLPARTGRSNDIQTILIALYVYEIWDAHAVVDGMKISGDLERMGVKERKFWIAETTRRVAVAVEACERVMIAHPEANEQVVKAFRKQHHAKVKNYRAGVDFEAEPYFDNKSGSAESDEDYEELNVRESASEVEDWAPATRRNSTCRDRGGKRGDVQPVEPVEHVESHDSDSDPPISANSGRGTRRAEGKSIVQILTAKSIVSRKRAREVSVDREYETTAIVKSNAKKSSRGKVVDSSDSEYDPSHSTSIKGNVKDKGMCSDKGKGASGNRNLGKKFGEKNLENSDPTYRPVEIKRNKRRAKSSKTRKARSKKPYLEYYYDS
ncbi:hypothetical protein BDZ45DRAFT_750535 [Acephala macrosclerotiorum]|nr:hypothetical protein BDZ45DRAFT_750535 [Acephala macrosclerotiorum]